MKSLRPTPALSPVQRAESVSKVPRQNDAEARGGLNGIIGTGGGLLRRLDTASRRWLTRPVVVLALLLSAFFLIQRFVPLRTAVEIGADEGLNWPRRRCG